VPWIDRQSQPTAIIGLGRQACEQQTASQIAQCRGRLGVHTIRDSSLAFGSRAVPIAIHAYISKLLAREIVIDSDANEK
jgi:hypothetical protein